MSDATEKSSLHGSLRVGWRRHHACRSRKGRLCDLLGLNACRERCDRVAACFSVRLACMPWLLSQRRCVGRDLKCTPIVVAHRRAHGRGDTLRFFLSWSRSLTTTHCRPRAPRLSEPSATRPTRCAGVAARSRTTSRRCGPLRRAARLACSRLRQNRCASCAYPAPKMRKYNWGYKALRRYVMPRVVVVVVVFVADLYAQPYNWNRPHALHEGSAEAFQVRNLCVLIRLV